MSVGKLRGGLVDLFRTADQGTVTRTIVVKIDIDSEELYNVADGRASVSLQRDYQQVQNLADMHGPCYLLVKHPGPNQWRLYTYCPDSESVKTKMLYASSKETLLNALSQDKFAHDMHASTKEDLSFNNIEGLDKPAGDSALAPWELERKKIEAAERKEASSRSSARGSGSGIGGYHSVSMPLDQSALDLISSLKSGSSSLIELRVNDSKDKISGVASHSGVTLSTASSKVNKSEPRFYVLKDGGSYHFLYMCPDRSAVSNRMVYSTAKPAAISGIKNAGITIGEAVEASDPDDVNASLFARRVKSYGGPSSASSSSRDQQPDWLKHRSAVVGGGSSSAGSSHTPYGAQVKTANKVGITSAHPTAQLMFSNNSPGPKKKIVVPPPGAW